MSGMWRRSTSARVQAFVPCVGVVPCKIGKPKHFDVSLRGGLLRLMMAGCVYSCFDPMGFLVGFVVSEFIAWLSTFSGKEGLRMVKKVLCEVIAFASRIKGRVIASWEAHLPFRVTLLTSP